RIPLADSPHQVIVDPALNVAAISLSNKTVSIVNLASGDLTSINIGGDGITDLGGIDEADHIVAFGSKTRAMISFIKLDATGGTLLKQIEFPGDSPEAIPFYPPTGKFYALLRSNIAVIDPVSLEVEHTWDLSACRGHNIVFGPNGEG